MQVKKKPKMEYVDLKLEGFEGEDEVEMDVGTDQEK